MDGKDGSQTLLRRCGLRAKIMLGLGLALCPIVGVQTYNWYSAQKTAEASYAASAVSDLRREINLVRMGLREYSLTQRPTSLEAVNQHKAQYQELLKPMTARYGGSSDTAAALAAVNTSVEALLDHGLKMADAYIQYDRVVGNTFLDEFFTRDDAVAGALLRLEDGFTKEAKARLTAIPVTAGIALGLVVGSTIIFSMMLAWRLLIPIRSLLGGMDRLAQGDLTVQVSVTSGDELGSLAKRFNEVVPKLREMIGRVAHVTDKVASASAELSATAEQMSKGAETLASRTTQTAAAVEEMNATVAEVAGNSGKAAQMAQETVGTASNGRNVVSETIAGMEKISDAVSQSAAIITALGKSSDQIGEIVRVIEDIADQTNLLALNAAIEAARAGEQGRGFAVVAVEVRKLAERTTKATKEIGDMIRQIQQDTRGAVSAMEEGTQKVKGGVTLVNRTGEALAKIVEMVTQSADMIRQIAVAADQQSAATQHIAEDLENVAKVTKESEAGANESARASHDLSLLATELQGVVGGFRISADKGRG
jgi:methyl-accepting chemotaxis protein